MSAIDAHLCNGECCDRCHCEGVRLPMKRPVGILPDPTELIARQFPKRRITLKVTVNLDPVPGWGNDPEDYRALTQRLLDDAIGHYRPTVTVVGGVA